MEKIRERNTAFLEIIKSFFDSDDPEIATSNEYERWKKDNADKIDSNEINKLENMLERNKRNNRSVTEVVKKVTTGEPQKPDSVNILENNVNIDKIQEK